LTEKVFFFARDGTSWEYHLNVFSVINNYRI